MKLRPALRADWLRLRDSAPAIAQIVLASVGALLIAELLLQQSAPLIAAIIPISSLGFVGDARPVRVLETAVAMTLGISLAEALVTSFGQTAWTFATALTVTLALARFVSAKAAFAIAAAVQCTLVMLGPVPPGGPFIRSADAVIGGAVALLATALIPRNPWGAAVRTGRRLIRAHVDVLDELASALRSGDAAAAAAALAHARATSAQVDVVREAVDSGRAIAAVSPWLWRRRSDFDRLWSMVEPVDLATRGLRVLARRADYLVGLGSQEPELADALHRISRAVALLGDSIADVTVTPIARHELTELAKHLSAAEAFGRGTTAYEANVIHAARPYVTDLLVASGLSLEVARAALAPLE